VCASQHDTGGQRQLPEPQQPHALSPQSSAPAGSAPLPRWSQLLLTFRAPRRSRLGGEPLPGKDLSPASAPLLAIETVPDSNTGPDSNTVPVREALPDSDRLPGSNTRSDSERPPAGDRAPRPPQPRTSGNARAGTYATRRVDASLIVIGAALFLCALATLISTWAWSWRTGAGGTFSLSHMHGICTSAMGELAQGASGTVSSHCLWVDGTWTEAVLLIAGGCVLAVIGIVRTLKTRT